MAISAIILTGIAALMVAMFALIRREIREANKEVLGKVRDEIREAALP